MNNMTIETLVGYLREQCIKGVERYSTLPQQAQADEAKHAPATDGPPSSEGPASSAEHPAPATDGPPSADGPVSAEEQLAPATDGPPSSEGPGLEPQTATATEEMTAVEVTLLR